VEDEGEQLIGPEVEARHPNLGLGIQVLGQLPEAMGTSQAVPLDGTQRPIEVIGYWSLWQLSQRSDSHHPAKEHIKQQLPGSIGKGRDPLSHSRAAGTATRQTLHEAIDAQTNQKVERDDVLQKQDLVMPKGVQEVGKQAVRAPADLAADSLHADVVDYQARASLPLVGAPADQGVRGSTVGMRTAVGNSKEMPRKRRGLGVVLGRMGVVLYNDHVGAPPFVVISVKMRPHREAFSFLASLFPSPIVLPFAILVNLIDTLRRLFTASCPFNHCDRSDSRSAAHSLNLAVVCPILIKECGL
jgi:hypothetical protein